MTSERYNARDSEPRWQRQWEEKAIFSSKNDDPRPKYYVLEMFPYPSGRIHIGHVRNYTLGDVLARYMRAKGFNVIHPMGWDAFGLPAENAAIERKVAPKAWTYDNIAAMKKQLRSIGLSLDWSREFATCDPSYYKHQQKMFLDFLKAGLAERENRKVNWDPVDMTVLANEQVIDGRGWRSGAVVEQREMSQWVFKITKYSQELLDALDTLDRWPDRVKVMQRNWIGRSEGLLIRFALDPATTPAGETELRIFTTRPDTLFGAKFMAISADHPLAQAAAAKNPKLAEFIAEIKRIGTAQEIIDTAEKQGFDTGIRAVHPFDPSWTLPVYVANFVLMEDGAGAIFHQHEVRDIDRQGPARVERVHGADAGIKTLLLRGVDDLLRGADAFDLGDELGEFWILRSGGLRQRMVSRDRHEFSAEQRVRARREDSQFILAGGRGLRVQRETNQQAFGAADPVALHQPHLVGPAVQPVQRFQELLRVLRDLEDPLVHFLLLDGRARAPAAAVDHLLVGKHGHVDRIPVHLALLALGQPRLQEVEEHLLLMLVVGGVAGRELAGPVERQADRAQLLLHRGDVVVGPGLRRHLALDRGVLRRQAERIPAHRMQHVVAARAHVARQHVAERVVADMADMDAPGRVGEHLEHVVFRPRVVVFGGEDRLLVPEGLPSRLGFTGVVTFASHGIAGIFSDLRRFRGRRTRP